MQCREADAGYATLTAIVLCAAVSILCAGALSLSGSGKAAEARKLERLQLEEAMNSAVMQFTADVFAGEPPYAASADRDIMVGARRYAVHLAAQAEHAKWPIDRAAEVDEKALSGATRQSRQEVIALIASGRPNDCIASLFSDLGQADPEKERPTRAGILFNASAKTGQVWRVRAVSGTRVDERRIRFLGDPDRLFAVVSVHRTSLGEMPECADLIKMP